MSEQIKILAEFMGWELMEDPPPMGGIWYRVSPDLGVRLDKDWGWSVWMLVEARIWELGFEEFYLGALLATVVSPDLWRVTRRSCLLIMAATLEQRMTAALQVIQEQVCPECKGLTAIEVDGECGLDLVICPNCKKDEGVGEEQADD